MRDKSALTLCWKPLLTYEKITDLCNTIGDSSTHIFMMALAKMEKNMCKIFLVSNCVKSSESPLKSLRWVFDSFVLMHHTMITGHAPIKEKIITDITISVSQRACVRNNVVKKLNRI